MKMRKRRARKFLTALVFSLALILSLAACGGRSGGGEASTDAGMPSSSAESDNGFYFTESEGTGSSQAAPGAGEAQDNLTGQSLQSSGAKLIRRAELNIQTEQFDQAVQALDQLVQSCGGYYERSQVEGGSLRNQSAARYGEYVLRLPQEQLDSFLDQSGALGYVTSRSETSENVSQEYYDTQARLTAQRTKQERLLALLAQADSMETIVALEDALSDTEYEIESLTTSLNHYDSLISYSTVTLHLEEVAALTQSPGETAALGQRVSAGLAASLRSLTRGTTDLIVWFSYHVIFVLVLCALAAGGAFYYRSRHHAKPPKMQDKQDKNP